jgi:hypothetical protein
MLGVSEPGAEWRDFRLPPHWQSSRHGIKQFPHAGLRCIVARRRQIDGTLEKPQHRVDGTLADRTIRSRLQYALFDAV